MVNIDYLYNPDAVKSNFDKNYFLDKKLGFQIIEHGMILPYKNTSDQSWGAGGIVDNMGNHIKDSFVHASLVSKTYTPPQNQFNIAQRLSFISVCFITYGDMT